MFIIHISYHCGGFVIVFTLPQAFNYMMSMGYITFNENYKYNVKPRGALQILPKVDYQQYKKFRPLAILYKTK